MTIPPEPTTSSEYARTLGIEIESAGESSAALLLPYKDDNSNPGRALHGGVTASLMAAAGRAVAEAALGESVAPFHTAHLNINYLAAPIGEAIRAEATLLRKGKELCFVNVVISTAAGKPVAQGSVVVRGRFGAEAAPPEPHAGDAGGTDPGPFGGFMHERVPFLRGLGVRVEDMSGGCTRLRLPFAARNAAADGGVAEGAILALLDTCGSMASWAGIKPGPYRSSTVALHGQMTGLSHPGDDLIAYGRLAQRDREIFWADVEIVTAVGRSVIARGGILYRIVIPDTIPWA